MAKLESYLHDGAGYQARAVLMHLQRNRCIIESSWDEKYHCYRAEVEVARWENCREQGYVVTLRNRKHDQINIAFFEYRNTDSICAIQWLQDTINSPNIDTAKFKDVYKNKYDVSHSVGYHQYSEMGDWIYNQLKDFYEKEDKECWKNS